MSTMADRLRDARLKAGYETGSDAARAFGWPVSTYLGHENGDRKFNYDTAAKYARAFSRDWIWLLTGEGNQEQTFLENTGTLSVPLVGLVGNGGYVEPKLNELYGHSKVFIDIPLFTPHNLVALEIIADNSERYDRGDIVICRTGYDEVEGFLDKFCLIETADGIWYLRKIAKSDDDNQITLKTSNAPDVENVQINQVGSIFLVLPAAQVGPPHGFLERVRRFGDPREPVVKIGPALRKSR